jgi:hypothetical protein
VTSASQGVEPSFPGTLIGRFSTKREPSYSRRFCQPGYWRARRQSFKTKRGHGSGRPLTAFRVQVFGNCRAVQFPVDSNKLPQLWHALARRSVMRQSKLSKSASVSNPFATQLWLAPIIKQNPAPFSSSTPGKIETLHGAFRLITPSRSKNVALIMGSPRWRSNPICSSL